MPSVVLAICCHRQINRLYQQDRTMNIYVGNLAWKTRQKELRELFENFGEVSNAFIVRDKNTRRSRGFGFVEMAEESEALEAIEKLNNTVFLDRTIVVNEAHPKEDGNGDVITGDDDNGEDRIGNSGSASGPDKGENDKAEDREAEDREAEDREAEASGEDVQDDSDESGKKPAKGD